MENIKISYAALESYRNFTRKNKQENEIMLRLKLLRNWIISNTIYENEEIEVREYGNLRMTVAKETKIMNKVYNFKTTWEFTNEEKFKEIKARAKVYDVTLGIDDIKRFGYQSKGYEINARAYKNFIFEKGFITYRDLLEDCVHFIQNGELVKEFNDKKIIKYHDWTITLTDNKYITNIRIEGEF